MKPKHERDTELRGSPRRRGYMPRPLEYVVHLIHEAIFVAGYRLARSMPQLHPPLPAKESLECLP